MAENNRQKLGLPTDWVACSVNDLYEITGGGTPSTKIEKYWDGDIPWITSADIQGLEAIAPRKKITIDAAQNSAANIVPENSIIVVTRVGLGKVALSKRKISFSQDCQGLVAYNELVLPKYAVYYLSKTVEIFKFNSRGTTISGVTKRQLKELPFLLPPLLEQHQIVAKIEELFSELDNGIESLKKAREQLKTYRQAVLKYAFEGKLTKEWRTQQIQAGNPPEPAEKLLEQIKTERAKHSQKQLEEWKIACDQALPTGRHVKTEGNKKPPKPKKPKELPPLTEMELAELPKLPEGWCWVRFGKLVDDFKRGPFGSTIKKEFFVLKGIKIYEQKNAIYKSEVLGNYFISNEKFKELSQFEVNPGDYIVSCSGTIGKIYRLPEKAPKGVINQALLRIRISENCVVHSFFKNLFESETFQRKILKDTKGSAMVNLAGVKELEVVPFAYCSLEEQQAIVSEIESRLSICDKIEQTIEDSLKKAEALRQSILKKAFNGELTQKWREKHPELISGENSAGKLLERIKAEKAVAADREKVQSKKMKKK